MRRGKGRGVKDGFPNCNNRGQSRFARRRSRGNSRGKLMPPVNQNPEQVARDQIDAHLAEAGWHVQTMKGLDWSAGQGIAVREYQTDTGPADYVLFVDRRAVGVIEAKPNDWGHKITTVEEQSSDYA